jgi:hypothetical protein
MTQQESRDSRHNYYGLHGHVIVETVETDDSTEEGWEYISDDGYLLTFLPS